MKVCFAAWNRTLNRGLGSGSSYHRECQTDKNGKEKVIAYASKQLAKHEKNYTPFLVEMAAMTWAMEHFNTYLKGCLGVWKL